MPAAMNDTEAAVPEPGPHSQENASKLFIIWQEVVRSMEKKDLATLRKYSFDSAYCQTCEIYPKGTYVKTIPARLFKIRDFMMRYTDSFLYPKIPHSILGKLQLKTEYETIKIKNPGGLCGITSDSILVYDLRFVESEQYSFLYRFTKVNSKFRFIGLYF